MHLLPHDTSRGSCRRIAPPATVDQNQMEQPINPPTLVANTHPLEINHDASAHAAQRNRSRCYHAVRCSTWSLVMIFLMLSLVILIAWSIINPHNPSFVLDKLSVSNITLSDSQFTANYKIEFIIRNTNKKVYLSVDHVKVDVLYGKAMISERDFEQTVVGVEKMKQGILAVELRRDSSHSVKKEVFKDISDDWSKKMVNFNVETFVRTKFEVGTWPTKEKLLKVVCQNLAVEFLSAKGMGRLMNAGKAGKVCIVQPR